MNIYVGNLPITITEDELRQEFATFGEVLSVTLMNNKYIGSGQPRGYAYVEMPSRPEGEAAIAAINGKQLNHMTINVIEALPLSKETSVSPNTNKKVNRHAGRERERKD